MSNEKSYHMSIEEFRRNGRAVIDWIADYYERIESFPVLARVQPGEIRASLPQQPPANGEPFDSILRDVEKLILPGITHWQSPNFFAFFPCNASAPAILGDLLSSGLGIQGMLWATSPACTELETHVLDWLVEMLGLPEKFLSTSTGGGVIQDSASSASLCAILAARERATGYAGNKQGCKGDLVAYASPQAHSSIEKAVSIAGLGDENLRLIEVDATSPCAPSSGGANRSRPASREDPLHRLRHRGHHLFQRPRPLAGDRADLPKKRHLAARGLRHVRHGRALPGVPLHQRGPGTGG